MKAVCDEFTPRLDLLQQHLDTTNHNFQSMAGSIAEIHAQLMPPAQPTTAASDDQTLVA
jgi:hypothetical protein